MTQETRLSFVKQADELLPPQGVLEVYKAQADYMVKAGIMPPGYRNGSDVLVVALRGREMGVPFWRSINGMFPMKGRIGFMGTFALGMVAERMPTASISVVESTPERCSLHIHRPNWSDDRFEDVEVTYAEAHAAHWDETWNSDPAKNKGVIGWVPKPVWADRRNMLYWRAVTRSINRYFEDVLGGACYTADELSDLPEEPTAVPVAEAAQVPGKAPYVTAAQASAAGNGKPPIDVVPQAVETPAPPPAAPAPQAEIPFPSPGEVAVPSATSWTEVPGGTPDDGLTPSDEEKAAQAAITVDHALVARFKDVADKCLDRKSLDTIWEDYKKGAGPATLTALFNVKKEASSHFAPAPKPSR